MIVETTTRNPARPRSRATPASGATSRPVSRAVRRTSQTADTAPPAEFVEPVRRERSPEQGPCADRSTESMRRLRTPFTPDDQRAEQR
ncbi:hypothetical protein IQ251_04565 [Saccharopolyspora sp. HNM0983]|uniref:Uncharacterized protein n=1 Tax=Saccharopolyspora montiporae TaxID=2781240 RepID=A0A929B8E5_9PSEU|nr:hypothetical protein [Saccharopolyspora sp. HNM0983]MBE9373720.1 hypothetical protein [Saccharopolyspora sp. HNM0983]